MKQTEKPGVMLYFEIRSCIRHLNHVERSLLLEAILDYGQNGIEPDFDDDPALAVAWEFVRDRLDRDDEAYREKREQCRRAINKRWHGEEEEV